MLDGKSVDEKKVAAKALSSLLQYSGNRKIFQKEERGIISAVNYKCGSTLRPFISNLDKKYLFHYYPQLRFQVSVESKWLLLVLVCIYKTLLK
uniref:Uncharacterized protein n=1 Tax=Cucumis melo TaxID=3656 RepID=A0A9I9CFR3_CUCME